MLFPIPQAGLPPAQPTRERLPPGPAPAHPRRPRAHVDPGLARAGLAPRSAASSLEKPDTCGILGTKVGRLSTPQFICLSFTPWPLAPLSPPQPCTVPLCGEKHAPKAQALLVFRTLSQEERLILRCSLETSGVLFLSQRSAIGGENCNSKRSHFS